MTWFCAADFIKLCFSPFAQLLAFWCLFLQLAAVQCMIYTSASKTFIFLNIQASPLCYINVYFVNLDLSRWYTGPTDITGKAVLDLKRGQVTLKDTVLVRLQGSQGAPIFKLDPYCQGLHSVCFFFSLYMLMVPLSTCSSAVLWYLGTPVQVKDKVWAVDPYWLY